MEMKSSQSLLNAKGQGHLVNFAKITLIEKKMVKLRESTSQKQRRLNETVFHMKPKWDEQKVMIVKWSRSLDQDGRYAIKCSKP